MANSRRVRVLLLALLCVAALISTARGVQNAWRNSQDLQWSGARLLAQHIDPWETDLAGDPHHLIRLTQQPNYLPLLYVLIAPLGWMPAGAAQVTWAVANILFALGSCWLAGRFFGLSRYMTAVVCCLLLASTPARMTIGNGQTGLLIVFFWSVGLLVSRVTDGRAAVAGCSYAKFSFGPPVVVHLWLRAGWRAVMVSVLPVVAGLLLVWLWLTGGHDLAKLPALLTAPLRLMPIGYFPNGREANLMDCLEVPLYRARLERTMIDAITFLISFAVCFVALFRAARGPRALSLRAQTALMAVLSFALFKHHAYDSVVLLFALCYLLPLWRHRVARVALLVLGYVWYVERVVDQLAPSTADWIFFPLCALLLVLAALLFRLRNVETAPDGESSTGPETAQAAIRPVN